MNEDAFARRFYADRSELESLGIRLTVDRPADGAAEQENYSLRSEHFHLPSIAFTDEELASLQFALTLLDGEFAYAEPLRLALQQITWGRPSPLAGARTSAPSRSASRPRPADTSSRSAWRRSRRRSSARRRSPSTTSRSSATRPARARSTRTTCCSATASSTCSATATSATRSASSGSRGSRARSPTRPRPSATSAVPTDFDPRVYGITRELAVRRRDRRRRGLRSPSASPGRSSATSAASARSGRTTTARSCSRRSYANARQLISWVLGLGEHAHVEGPAELVAETEERIALLTQPPRRRVRARLASPGRTPQRRARRRSATTARRAAARMRRSGRSASRGS